jgi:hypothetical protein
MGLAGSGAVAIWHDIAPEGRDEFYAWHGREHMPERVDIPGFLRGRRYIAPGESPEYFNLYETESPATVTGADYRARLENPTPWTIATVKHFRGVSRSLCRVAASAGEGEGGLIATLRYDVQTTNARAHERRVAVALVELAKAPGVAGAHLLVADEAASAIETAEKKVRAEKNLIPPWIVMIEGWGDVKPFAAFCREQARGPLFADALAAPALGIYHLQNTRGKAMKGHA